MTTVQFKPMCPFGGADDFAMCRIDVGKCYVFNLAADLFLLVRMYLGSDDASYLIGTKREVQNVMLELIEAVEDTVVVDEPNYKKFRAFKFSRVTKRLVNSIEHN